MTKEEIRAREYIDAMPQDIPEIKKLNGIKYANKEAIPATIDFLRSKGIEPKRGTPSELRALVKNYITQGTESFDPATLMLIMTAVGDFLPQDEEPAEPAPPAPPAPEDNTKTIILVIGGLVGLGLITYALIKS